MKNIENDITPKRIRQTINMLDSEIEKLQASIEIRITIKNTLEEILRSKERT